jgi:hypothetical protein
MSKCKSIKWTLTILTWICLQEKVILKYLQSDIIYSYIRVKQGRINLLHLGCPDVCMHIWKLYLYTTVITCKYRPVVEQVCIKKIKEWRTFHRFTPKPSKYIKLFSEV